MACTIEDMYKNFQILSDAKEKAGEVTTVIMLRWICFPWAVQNANVENGVTNYRIGPGTILVCGVRDFLIFSMAARRHHRIRIKVLCPSLVSHHISAKTLMF